MKPQTAVPRAPARRAWLAALTLLLAAAGAEAAPDTYVSVLGRDVWPCTRVRPCRTFARALAVTDPGGSVTALDSGRYDTDFIDVRQSVTLGAAPGVRAELTSTNGGIYVNALPGDVVTLRELTLVGQDTPPNNAIIFNGGAALHVESCVVYGWPTKGILALGAPGRLLFVKDSLFRDNFIGVSIDAAVTGSLERTRFEHNTFGLAVTVTGRATARDCSASGNSNAGFLASGFGANNVAELNLEGCLAVANGTGVRAEGFGAGSGVVRLSNSTITRNGTGLKVAASGALETRGNNTVAGNAPDVDGTLTPLAPR